MPPPLYWRTNPKPPRRRAITSPSSIFAVGFRAVDSDSGLMQYILATLFRFTSAGTMLLATRDLRSASRTAARQLTLVDGANGSNNVLRAPLMNSSVKRAWGISRWTEKEGASQRRLVRVAMTAVSPKRDGT